ncbi:hypothetical protein K8374_19855 [Pseudomonas sp. p1(2021b)]|uniref:hypothetical protein n=1 Tax=Pseudomonas sp. p1(2021b) TaxID=2874628 RepID=UPI001CCAC942|nr:hypothetical protein [Pseudomonas sp. p1(2021b)]UBM24597.1 hypothetical protein K8374_19855 [Pseudomonas sp. p1(2021b)]
MSVIAIVIEGDVPPSVLMKLHRIIGASLQQLRSAVQSRNPILELEIFDGDYQERAALIRAVIATLIEGGVVASYYEIPYGQQYAGNIQLSLWKIDSDLVEGILSAADKEVERQLNN